MMFVTGDVHHEGLGTRDQAYLDTSEIELARKYADIAARHDVAVTLFVSGRTVEENPAEVAALADRDGVELGGHNWDCFERSTLHYLSELVLGTHYGPAWYQRRDVRRTLDAIEARTGMRPRVWRSHAYVEDDRTPSVLADAGVAVVSNAVDPDGSISARAADLVSLPINTIPDHAHVHHGWLSESYVRRQRAIREGGPSELLSLGRVPTRHELVRAGKEAVKAVLGSRRRSAFERDWYAVDGWERELERQAERAIESRGFATVLAHPACMEIADGMTAFERFCEFASGFDTAVVSRATELHAGGAGRA